MLSLPVNPCVSATAHLIEPSNAATPFELWRAICIVGNKAVIEQKEWHECSPPAEIALRKIIGPGQRKKMKFHQRF